MQKIRWDVPFIFDVASDIPCVCYENMGCLTVLSECEGHPTHFWPQMGHPMCVIETMGHPMCLFEIMGHPTLFSAWKGCPIHF
jgi:hypothetical protein